MNNWWLTAQEFLQTLRIPLGITASRAGEHFHAVFGRDSLWSMMLVLEAARLRPNDRGYREWAYDLSVAVLRGLAQLQGKVENDYNEEQPGKIVHEYWDPVPEGHLRAGWPLVDGRYYGTIDATFLYMIAMRQFYEMFHDNQLLDELWSNIQTAFHWALTYSDMDNDGLVEYERRNPNGHGLQRYGFEQEARLLASSVMRAINAFTLPVELYCVLPSRWVREPHLEGEWLLADYPQSCSVQAWTAAAILYFTALLKQA